MFSLLLSFELAIKLTCALSIALPSAVSCALVLSPVFFLVTYLLFSLMLASALISVLSGAFSSVLSHALPRAHSSNLAIKLTSALPCAHFGIALSFPFNGHIRCQEFKHLYSPRKPALGCNGLFQCLHQAQLHQAQFCRSSN